MIRLPLNFYSIDQSTLVALNSLVVELQLLHEGYTSQIHSQYKDSELCCRLEGWCSRVCYRARICLPQILRWLILLVSTPLISPLLISFHDLLGCMN